MVSPGGDVGQSCTLIREIWNAHRTLTEKQWWASQSNKQHGEEQTVTLSAVTMLYQAHTLRPSSCVSKSQTCNVYSWKRYYRGIDLTLRTFVFSYGIAFRYSHTLGSAVCACVRACVRVWESTEPTTQYNALNPASSQVSQRENYSTWKHRTFFIFKLNIAVELVALPVTKSWNPSPLHFGTHL